MKRTLIAVVAGVTLVSSVTGVVGAAPNSKEVKTQQTTVQATSSSFYEDLGWSWPTTSTTLSEGFGYVGWRYHKGIDIGVKLEPVRSAATGVIIQSGAYSDGIVAMTMRHNDVDPATGDYLVTRYLHLKKDSQKYSTGDHIGQYIEIATSGNTGNVGYHLHFDVNNKNMTYPGDSDTIDPMQFYPTVSGFAASGSTLVSKDSHDHGEDHKYRTAEYFFDNNVINFVGKNKFEKWFNSNKIEDRTITNLKKKFNLTDEKIKNLTSDKVKETELKMFGITGEK